MSTVIVPACGQSSRYGSKRPKFLWCHPFSNCMLSASLYKLQNVHNLTCVYLKSHEDEYKFVERIEKELFKDLWLPKTILLDSSTSQAETVYKAIKTGSITGHILVKDCDNQFKLDCGEEGNYVATSTLGGAGNINASNKSYVITDNGGNITSIVEKKVVSDTFCCGLYSFKDAEKFVETYEKLLKFGSVEYISDIVWCMILNGEIFKSKPVEDYHDWGTIEDWHEYREDYGTYFVDLDGTLVTNGSPHSIPYITEGQPLQENINVINNLFDKGAQIIVTTARPRDYLKATEAELARHGIKYDILICGLNHGRRILINDFAGSNPYPSCKAICIPRNSNNLKEYL